MHSGEVFRVRRTRTAVLWNQLRRRPFLPRERLFLLWQGRGNLLSRHQRDRPMRGGRGVQLDLIHRPLRPLRFARCALLPGQYLQQRLLLQQQLLGRRIDLHQQQQLELHLRFVQVRTLHLRQRRRAVLPGQHLPDQHRLRKLRLELHQQPRLHHFDLCGLRKGWRTMLLGQHLYGSGNPVSVRQLDRRLHVQSLWRYWPAVLLDHDQHHNVQGSHEPVLVQQFDGHIDLQNVRLSWRNLLLDHDRESDGVQRPDRRLR